MTNQKGATWHIYKARQEGLSHKIGFFNIQLQMELL